MATRQARRSIERKIITSILWVGVIPMTLALVIGYLFAHEGQRLAVQYNLIMAARKTAEGVNLAVEGRKQATQHLAQSTELVQALRHQRDPGFSFEPLAAWLRREAVATGGMTALLSLYDRDGRLLVLPGKAEVEDQHHPEWAGRIAKSEFVGFRFEPESDRYFARLVVPVHDPDSGEILGYLADDQDINSLLEFVLAFKEAGQRRQADLDVFEVVYVGAGQNYSVHLAEGSQPEQPRVRFDMSVDQRLAERLTRRPDKDYDTFAFWGYKTRGGEQDVLLAYHRLLDDANLFLVVSRMRSLVFANINIAAMLTIACSVVVIGMFCIIAYRNVHNNIIRPVSLLNEGSQIIRQGDFELKLKIRTGDEIEELAMSFNKMAAALRHNINQLEESEEKYRSLITSMRDGMYQTNAEGVVTFINPAAVEMMGYATEEAVLGRNIREVFVEPGDANRLTRELLRHGFVERTRVWTRRADGAEICLEVAANSVRGGEGRLLGIEGTFRDVTQSVRLEQEARERSERIAAINQIANVINSSIEAGRVYESIVAEVRKLASFDYAAVALLEESGERFSLRRLWPEMSDEEDASALSEGTSAAWVAREGRSLIVNDLRAADSPFAPEFPDTIQSCLCVPLYATGRIIGSMNLGGQRPGAFGEHEREVLEQMAPHLAVAIRNATLLDNLQLSLEEVTRAREELHRANAELKTLDEMKTNLLSNVSHELRTPLVAVMGYTDMILNEKAGPINELQQEYLGISLRNIEKLVTLIENLLDFSRLHRGQEELAFDTFDITDCAKTSIQIIQPVADSREIKVHLIAPEAPVLVEGDKGKLGQVFNNLLSNAVKFNEPGGTVTIEIRVANDTVDVTCTDTGIGIPDEALDKIFTRFYQYDGSSTRKYGGTGIGLSIAQDIMRLHGSRLAVSSKYGQGTTFRFLLPLSTAQVKAETPAQPTLPLPIETHLLVEVVTQDRALSVQLRNMLLSEGMDVVHAAFPAMALSLANRYNPDCILLDANLGGHSGAVVEELLNDPTAGGVPIVLLTNDDRLYERHRMYVAGRLRGGFRKSSLLSAIHYALSRGVGRTEPLGAKVLCVDDDPEVLTFICRAMESEGYVVEHCATGEAALERLQTGDYWLVLLDVAMPGIDGWETCERIRENPRLAGIKVYIVTAKPIDRTLREIQEAGADGFLQKPFKSEDLIALVQGFDTGQTTKTET